VVSGAAAAAAAAAAGGQKGAAAKSVALLRRRTQERARKLVHYQAKGGAAAAAAASSGAARRGVAANVDDPLQQPQLLLRIESCTRHAVHCEARCFVHRALNCAADSELACVARQRIVVLFKLAHCVDVALEPQATLRLFSPITKIQNKFWSRFVQAWQPSADEAAADSRGSAS